jgi:hypothetical protein
MLCTSVTSFPGRHSITSLNSLFIIWTLSITLVKVLTCTACILIESRTIEIVEHEIHIFTLLSLQMINNVLIAMNFNFNMSISLAGESSRLGELFLVFTTSQELLSITTKLKFLLLILFMVVTNVESFTAKLIISRSLRVRLSTYYVI